MFQRYLTVPLLVSSSYCYADLPLSLDELFTNKGKLKFETAIVYSNIDNKNLTSGDPIIIETGDGFITIPTAIGENRINSDTLIGTLGLRYGLTSRIEPYLRGSYLSNQQRITAYNRQHTRRTQHHWNDAILGVNYRFFNKNNIIEIVGYLETSGFTRYRDNNTSFKDYTAGFTSYYSIDPIVLSLTLSYQLALSRKIEGITYQPSHYLTINPNFGFAVNERITLLSGIQWFVRRTEKIAGVKQGLNQTNTSLQFGLGYGFTKDSTFSITANIKASGQSSSDIRLQFSHTFN